jgi:radical SAM superfamily enzyme YgiQ (UPF0313 family)
VGNWDKLKSEERVVTPFAVEKKGGALSGDIKVTIAYPNRYWVAMSNLGFQAVYKLFANQKRFFVERAFLPEEDNSQFSTFETSSPLSRSEILGVSVSFETDYPYVIRMLEAAGLKLNQCREIGRNSFYKEKTPYRPFILGGGAALTLNPEPLANFFDAIVVGEGEEVISEISETYLKLRDQGANYESLLENLALIEGVYVPSLFKAHYKSNNEIDYFSKAKPEFKTVNRRFVKNIDLFPTTTVIQTPNTEFRSMFMTETGRGCEVGCKFCVAGYMYRPVRKRSAEVLAETVQVGVEVSDSIGFVGAAVSSHPKISELASSVAAQGKRASLSSIMTQKVSVKLATSLNESEYKTVALAPEAGNEELRFRIGKRVCNEQIIEGVAKLAAGGIKNFKLYFIVGLPSETFEDVKDIPLLVEQASKAALQMARTQEDFSVAPKIFLSVNPFIPKAWTPFQRHTFMQPGELKKRLEYIRNAIRKMPNVEMKNESPRESHFQVVMSRGDRRVGDMLIEMHKEKKDWRWFVKVADTSLGEGLPPADFFVYRILAENETMPWEIVDLQIKRSLLERQYQKTFTEDVSSLIARAKVELAEDGFRETQSFVPSQEAVNCL